MAQLIWMDGCSQELMSDPHKLVVLFIVFVVYLAFGTYRSSMKDQRVLKICSTIFYWLTMKV